MPVLVDPLNPVSTDNVGWTGDTSGGTFTSLHTVPANTTRKGCVFLHDVILTDATSKLDDCIVFGGPPVSSRPGLITASNGGQLNRVTVYGLATSVVYYRNAVNYGGNFTATRCAMMRCCDAFRSSSGTATLNGCISGPTAFFNNDLNQPNGSPPNWGHADAMQSTAGAGPRYIIGCYARAWSDCTGVTWSGGSWGSGTASKAPVPTVHPTTRPTVATPIGMPEVALNAGYWNDVIHGGLYANGYIHTGVSGFITTMEDTWLEGGNNPSGLFQFTTGTTNQPTWRRNKFGIGGWWSGSVRYLAIYPSGTAAVVGTGADANVFGDFASCQARGIVGDPITITSGGGRYNGVML